MTIHRNAFVAIALALLSTTAAAQTPPADSPTAQATAPDTPPAAQAGGKTILAPWTPPETLGSMIVTDPPADVLTAEGFVAPEELTRALSMMRIPESGRFALTMLDFDPRTGERRGLRFDPRLPDGERWRVSEAPERENVERVTRRLRRNMDPMRNPDIGVLAATPSAAAMRFDGIVREDETTAVYAFQMIARTEDAERLADRMRGELVVSRPSGAPIQVRIFNSEMIRSGLARVDRVEINFALREVAGCCVVAVRQVQSASGSALFMPATQHNDFILEDVEFIADLPRDADTPPPRRR